MHVLQANYEIVIKIHTVLAAHSGTFSLIDLEQLENALYKSYLTDEITLRKTQVMEIFKNLNKDLPISRPKFLEAIWHFAQKKY
jgi:hypothetical protein